MVILWELLELYIRMMVYLVRALVICAWLMLRGFVFLTTLLLMVIGRGWSSYARHRAPRHA